MILFFGSTAFLIAQLVITAASAAHQISEGGVAKGKARARERAQKKEVRRQRRIESARQLRAARIRKARIAAAGGAGGIGGSVIAGAQAAIQGAAEGQVGIIDTTAAANIEQLSLQTSQQLDAISAQQVGAVTDFAETATKVGLAFDDIG